MENTKEPQIIDDNFFSRKARYKEIYLDFTREFRKHLKTFTWLHLIVPAKKGKLGKLSLYWFRMKYEVSLARHYRREVKYVTNTEFHEIKDNLWATVTVTERRLLKYELILLLIMRGHIYIYLSLCPSGRKIISL